MQESIMNGMTQSVLLVPLLRADDAGIAQAIAALGGALPRTASLADGGLDAEPRSARIEQFHAALLAEFGDAACGQDSPDSGWELRKRFEAEIPVLLDEEFGDAPLPLLASPGLPCFIAHWLQALRTVGITPKVVVPAYPRSVLEMPTMLRKFLDLEWQTRGCDRVIVFPGQHTDAPVVWADHVASELGLYWPAPPAAAETETGTPAQMQAQSVEDTSSVDGSGWQVVAALVHAAVCRIASANESGLVDEFAALDRVRRALGADGPQRRDVVSETEIEAAIGFTPDTGAFATGSTSSAEATPTFDPEGDGVDAQARMAMALLSSRRELAQVRSAQEAMTEQASRLPRIRSERDALAKLLARNLSMSNRQHNGPASLEARRTWRGRILKLLHPGRISPEEKEIRRHFEQIDMIEASPLFDGGWYLREYADVAARNFSPAEHYLRHGAMEGRNPGPQFDTKYYLHHYPDVADSGMNPLIHYLVRGAAEGRAIQYKAERPKYRV
jgi:hypothetical protein